MSVNSMQSIENLIKRQPVTVPHIEITDVQKELNKALAKNKVQMYNTYLLNQERCFCNKCKRITLRQNLIFVQYFGFPAYLCVKCYNLITRSKNLKKGLKK